MVWSRSAMRRCSRAVVGKLRAHGPQQLAELAADAADLENLLRGDLAVAHARQVRLDLGEPRLAFIERPRCIGAPLANDIGVFHVGFEQRVLSGKALRLAVGIGLALRRLHFLQPVDVPRDDRDAL